MEVAPHLKDSLNPNFFDLLSTLRQISGESVQNQLVLQRVEVPEYLTLYSPAINWILQCIAYRAPEARSLIPHSAGSLLTWTVSFKCSVRTAVCASISDPADGDDGAVQDTGQQVSAFQISEGVKWIWFVVFFLLVSQRFSRREKHTHATQNNFSDFHLMDVSFSELQNNFMSISSIPHLICRECFPLKGPTVRVRIVLLTAMMCVFPTVPCCWIQSWGRLGLNLSQ